jgi:hypothetical protein
MAIKVGQRAISVWITSDGQEFLDKGKARTHELALLFDKYGFRGMDSDDAAEIVFGHFKEFQEVMK